MIVYRSREDLRTAFPETKRGHIGRLLRWAMYWPATDQGSSRLKPYATQYRNLYTELLLQPDVYREKIGSKFMKGIGVEIGGLYRPFPISDNCQIVRVDLYDRKKLMNINPELSAEKIQSPDIIADGEKLSFHDCSLDFVVASHVVEHLRNPIGAIDSWTRTLKDGGYLILVIPHKNFTFDKDRSITPISHLADDAEHPSNESDFSHYLEFAELVNKKTGEGIEIEARRLCESRYSIHMHVFDNQSWHTFLSALQERFKVPLTVIESLDLGKEESEIITVLKKKLSKLGIL
jgi:SAM-dependent methyltransferase